MQIHTQLNKLSIQHWLWLYLVAALLIACRVMANQHGWVNNDSLLYFEQARLIGLGEWSKAYALFSWPFFASLIALVSQLTGCSIHSSAQILNALCFVAFVAGFQQLLMVAGATLRTLHWGHLVLFSTPYIVGDVLGMLLRDEGFWAAFTWGLVYFLRLNNTKSWKHMLLFQLWMTVAILFRIEAVAFYLLLPLLLLRDHSHPWTHRLRLWLQAQSFAVLACMLIVIALCLGVLQASQLGRLQEIVSQITHLFTDRSAFIAEKAEMFGKQILGKFLDEYATMCVLMSFVMITLVKTATVAGIGVLGIVCWPNRTWWASMSVHYRQTAIAVLVIGFVVSLVIILNVLVLSSRYVISSGIILLSLAAFALSNGQQTYPKAIRTIAAVLLLMLMNNLWDHQRSDLDRLTTNYVQSLNTQQQPVFYDTENARFYAGQPFLNRIDGYSLLKQVAPEINRIGYGFFVISVHKGEDSYETYARALMRQHHYQLREVIYGWRKKSKALIFEKSEHD